MDTETKKIIDAILEIINGGDLEGCLFICRNKKNGIGLMRANVDAVTFTIMSEMINDQLNKDMENLNDISVKNIKKLQKDVREQLSSIKNNKENSFH